MPRNVELKARLADLGAARVVARRLGARYLATEGQVDRYYELGEGRRVKLRTSPGAPAALITYDRPETDRVRISDYRVTPVRDGDSGLCLVPKTAPLVVVRKRREVHVLGNVRIHLDEVQHLGTFLELDANVDPAHDEAACRRRVAELAREFGLSETDGIRASYGSLLRAL